MLDKDEQQRLQDPALIRFRAVNGQDTYEEIVSYNQVMNHLDQEDGAD